MDRFFEHENQAYPPALSQFGKMKTGTKFDLAGCLGNLVLSEANVAEGVSVTNVVILDGAAIVHILHPGATNTIKNYTVDVFIPCVESPPKVCSC